MGRTPDSASAEQHPAIVLFLAVLTQLPAKQIGDTGAVYSDPLTDDLQECGSLEELEVHRQAEAHLETLDSGPMLYKICQHINKTAAATMTAPAIQTTQIKANGWLGATRATIGHFNRLRRQRRGIAIFDKRWPPHGAHSGYLINDGSWVSLPRRCRVTPYLLRRLLVSITGDESCEERYLIYSMLRAADTKLLHLVDGDSDGWLYRKRHSWVKAKITATFHQPVGRLSRIASQISPGMLDGIVCVSRDQVSIMKHLAPDGRCVFIPHGVDTDFFSEAAPEDPHAAPLILSVGAHWRDFDTLVNSARFIRQERPDARVLLVGNGPEMDEIARSGVVETLSGISDAELRLLYQTAKVVLLPLLAASANNALLEAMAVGRPSIITDLPAVRDYATTDTSVFCKKGDASAYAAAALSLLRDGSLRSHMGASARSHVRRFSWPNVRRLLARFLQDVAAG